MSAIYSTAQAITGILTSQNKNESHMAIEDNSTFIVLRERICARYAEIISMLFIVSIIIPIILKSMIEQDFYTKILTDHKSVSIIKESFLTVEAS